MTVQAYLRVLRERWVLVGSVIAVAVVVAGAVWFIRPVEYTARQTLYVSAQSVSAQDGDSVSAAFEGAQLSRERVTSYVRLVASTRVTRGVIRELGLTDTPEQLAERVTATNARDSVLIDVAVTGRDPAQTAAVTNAVSAEFTALVEELERPSSAGGVPAVAVRAVEPAAVPTEPSSAGLVRMLAIGLLAGLAAGVGAALLRHRLDTSLTSSEQLREVAQCSVLGTIAFDHAVPGRPLTVHEDPQSPRAEAFRGLRTNLQFVDVDNPRKVIVVTSPLPEEGKTTVVCNLAIALGAADSRVLVIEADLRRPRVADLLGLERAVGLTTVLAGRVGFEQAVQPWSGGLFDVLTSGQLPPNPSELLASKQMKALLGELRERYDVVLIDSPPLLAVTDAAALAPATDGAIVVCRFRRTTRDQLRNAVEALHAVSARVLGTVFTMVPSGTGPSAYTQYTEYYGVGKPIVGDP